MDSKTEPLRICFVCPKAYPLFDRSVKKIFGGAEVDLYMLATEIAKDDNFEVSFIVADYGQEESKTIRGVKIIRSLDFKKNAITGAVKIWQAMRVANAYVYLQKTASAGTFLVALFCKLNKKTFVYRTASQRECNGEYLKKHFLVGKIFRWSMYNAKQIVTQNQTDRQNLIHTISVDSTVIPNAHNLPKLQKNKRQTVLWAGRSAEVKRPELFIKLAQKVPDEQFTMICQRATGDEKYQELLARAAQVKNLEFIEQVDFDEIDRYFQRAKMLVNTSDSEGFPNAFIQACKCAAPILSLNVNPDNFLNKHKCGLCAGGDWNVFMDMLKQILNRDTAEKFGNAARIYAEANHDIAKIADIYKSLFKDLMQK